MERVSRREGITLRVTVKVRPGRQWAVQRSLRAQVMAAFEDAGIQRPGRCGASAPRDVPEHRWQDGDVATP